MASRQERRKAERTAAKRAPAKAGAAATAVNVTPLGNWTTQTEDPSLLFDALGEAIVKQMAAKGRGFTLVHFSAQLEPCLPQRHTLDTP